MSKKEVDRALVLSQDHNIKFCSEFISQLMIAYKLWIPKQKKKPLHLGVLD